MSENNIDPYKNTEKRITANCELRMADHATDKEGSSNEGRSRTVEGYAAVYGVWADLGWMKETIVRGAFKNALVNSDVRALLNHDRNQILAREKSSTLEVWEDDKGLGFRFDIPESRNDILEMVERGDIDECSFAFKIKEQRWVWNDDDGPDERYLEDFADIYDISLVTFPAYNDTSVALRSKQDYSQKTKESQSKEMEIMKMQLCLHGHSI